MYYIQLFAKDQVSNQYTELDLLPSDPIRVSDAVTDLADPTATPSAFSQTFRIPNTFVNGGYFKAVFNVNSEDYDPTLKAECYINIDGLYFMSGSLRLTNIITDNINNKIEYEIQFLGETRTFGGAIEGKYLADLNFDDYSHSSTYSNIVNSWNAGTNSPNQLFNGDIIYPLCEWGYFYDPETKEPVNTTLAVYAPGPTGGSVKGFTNSINPLETLQFKPFTRAKVIWDKIFEEAGFTYESEFITDTNGSFFSRLYMGCTELALPVLYDNPFLQNTISTAQPITIGGFTNQTLIFNTSPVVRDIYNKYDPVTGTYELPFNIGNLIFYFSLTFNYRSKPGVSSPALTFQLRRIRNGVSSIVAVTTRTISASQGSVFTRTLNFSMSTGAQQTGDIFFFQITPPSTFSYDFVTLVSGSILGETNAAIITPTVMFPNDKYTQKEFIKGITNKFNLIWENDPDNPKNFFIEPWVEWIARGRQYDWSNKLDENVPTSVESIFNTQSRRLVFTDTKEGDLYNFSFEQGYKKVFGQLNLDSNIEVLTGEKKIDSFFSPVPLAPIGNSNTFLIPHFAKDTEAERQPIEVRPRLVFYNGLVQAPLTWYMKNDFNVSTSQTSYPLISQFDSYPFTNSTFDLNWTNSPQFWDVQYNQNAGSGQTGITCFTTFWEKWYQSFYSPFSRVLTASFIVNNREIKNLRFNDLIFVKNAWWSPIKYSDFELGADGRVKFEMIKIWPPIGVTIGPTGGIAPASYFQGNLCFGNNLCQACCCSGPVTVSIWTDQPDIANSNFAYATASGVLPQEGYYKSGSFAYFITSAGAISAVFLCSTCECNPIVPEFLIEEIACVGETECEAFCCSGGTASVWSDGGITGATELYSSASGDPLTPFYWYSNGISALQVGASGSAVIQGTTGAGCDCTNLQYSNFVWLGVGPSGQLGSCCGQGMTGASGAQTVWIDQPFFLDSSEFWTDPTETIPYGDGAEEFLSDGQYYVGVTGGSPGSTGDCTVNICPGRTTIVQTRLINNSGTTGASLTSQNYISFDASNFFWANQDFVTGVTFDYIYDTNYDPSSFARNTIITGAGVTGDISYDILENSISVSSGTFGVTGSNTYSLPDFIAGTGSWEVQIEIIPN